MKIKGLIENSFLDWDGKISTIVFTGGCNFKCPFCHNRDLVLTPSEMYDIPENYIFDYILKNKKWIDGVVITGGEPLLQKDLLDFLKRIKDFGVLTKLDTNGYLLTLLKEAVEKNLVDYVAMDLKSSINNEKYSLATGTSVDIEKIQESIKFLLDGKIEHEFRTTIVPSIVNLDDLLNIASHIKNESKWAWQNFRKTETLIDSNLGLILPYSNKDLDEFEEIVKQKFADRKIIRR